MPKINPAQIKLDAIRQIIRDYHYALDSWDQEGARADDRFAEIKDALGMPYWPGEELKRREG